MERAALLRRARHGTWIVGLTVAVALGTAAAVAWARPDRLDLSAVDAATRAFAERVAADAGNRRLADRYRARWERLAVTDDEGRGELATLRRFTVLFVPGFAWKSDRSTGADFARQRALLERRRVEAPLLEIDENGRVDDNARAIADHVRAWGVRRARLILVSASKGGPETALALGSLLSPDELAPVAGWVSVGGLLRGTPHADRALTGFRRWLGRLAFGFKGLSFDIVPDLATDTRRAALAQLELPDEIVKVALIGAPLSTTIDREVRGRFETLAAFGPNDGLTLLEDEMIPGGLELVEPGLDHYFRDPQIDFKTLALASVVAEMALSSDPEATTPLVDQAPGSRPGSPHRR